MKSSYYTGYYDIDERLVYLYEMQTCLELGEDTPYTMDEVIEEQNTLLAYAERRDNGEVIRLPEPVVHCYDCPQADSGNCTEYNTLNPQWLKMGLGEYDRGHCFWGYESIKRAILKR